MEFQPVPGQSIIAEKHAKSPTNMEDKLDSLGLSEKTLIIVMGDKGNNEIFQFFMENGTQCAGGRGHTRFHGVQVPFIGSWAATALSSTCRTRKGSVE